MHTNKSVIGVDIGSRSLKLVCLIGGSGKVLAFSEVEIPNNCFSPKELKAKDKVLVSLQTALANAQPKKIRPHFVCSALPESVVFTKVITMPKMNKKDLDAALITEINQILPHSAEEMEVDKQILGSTEKEMDVLIIAADKNLILDLIQLFSSAKLNLIRLETKPASLGRLLINKELKSKAVVDIGASASSISIYQYGQIKLTATVPVGGDAWKKALNENLIQGTESQIKIEDFVSTLDVITGELQNAVYYHQSRSMAAKPVEEIILAGGGSMLPGISDYFQKKFSITTAVANSPVRFLNGMDNRYLVALGAAIDPPI